MFFILLLVAGGLVFVVSDSAEACWCSQPPPFDKAVKQAEAVFAGVVTSIEPTSQANFKYNFEVDEVVVGEVGPRSWSMPIGRVHPVASNSVNVLATSFSLMKVEAV